MIMFLIIIDNYITWYVEMLSVHTNNNLAAVRFVPDACKKSVASAGNRTRAARVAGEHSTTEPPMLDE